MGREAEGHCRWNGQDGVAKAILEREVLILRGEVKARLPRGALRDWRAEGGALTLQTLEGPLTLELGEKEALAWVKALDKPAPTLAERLGLGAGCAVIGTLPTAVVLPQPPASLEQAQQVLATLSGQNDLAQLTAILPGLKVPLWCLYRKGKAASPTDATIRSTLRGAGWMDTKVSGIDAEWTATRYNPLKA